MSIFSERLKVLRIEKNLTQAQLARETGLSQSGIALWESGNRAPKIEVIITLARFFGVTSDYLLGLADE